LKNRPVKASPQVYERWIKGLERELQEMKQHAHNIHALEVYREVLGE